tara:strand:- start:1117 stop:2133 length:1017 start_codon:yes stop_codon:yes gene_type:complete
VNNKVCIIAEAGVNHNGDIELAKRLIKVASEAGADYVKFQSFKAESLVCKNAKKAEYQIRNTGKDDAQFEMIKRLELSRDSHFQLQKVCNEEGIKFLSTPFDLDSLNLILTLDMDFIKIPSGEITHWPFLNAVGASSKPVILSTGMSFMEEVRQATEVLYSAGLNRNNLTVLHCNTEYPTPMEDVNLRAMNTIADTLGVKVGYSDHTLGIEVALGAVSRGACVIEKHFTLDRDLPGPDHRASLEPNELKNMVDGIRSLEKALGDNKKLPSNSEVKNISIARRSIVANTPIFRGDTFNEVNVICKRPSGGINPMQWPKLIGKVADRDYAVDDQIQWPKS